MANEEDMRRYNEFKEKQEKHKRETENASKIYDLGTRNKNKDEFEKKVQGDIVAYTKR